MNTLNIHPIFVHFPIALLTVYAIFELCRIPILVRQQWWFPVKAVLLFSGFLGGFVSLQTGEWAEESLRGTQTMSLVELHSTFASATMWVYGILAALYLVEWIRRTSIASRLPDSLQKMYAILCRVERVFFKTLPILLASLAGLVLITITGALGGAITYGPDVDPIVSFIYHLFFN